MKIRIDHYTPVPNFSIVGCEQGFGCERLEIAFEGEWKRLKKHVTLYFSEDDSDNIVIQYKNSPVDMPRRIYEKPGVYRYVISGENAKKHIVCKTGYLTVLRSPEPLPKPIEGAPAKKKVATI